MSIGIDGCRGGWFLVKLDPRTGYELRLAERLDGLLEEGECGLVDMPIGLPQFRPRRCDGEARRLLGRPRSSSVFSVPVRQAVYAGDYATACVRNREALGCGLSVQTWNIVPRIRELDRLLRSRRAKVPVLRECHPELAFWGLNGGRPMRANKATAAGRQERLEVLRRHLPGVDALLEDALGRYPRRQVAPDDVLDATVLAQVMAEAGTRLIRLPREPEWDAEGLSMEIVYCGRPSSSSRGSSTPASLKTSMQNAITKGRKPSR
jgi:predicted RNase H-like nuclease